MNCPQCGSDCSASNDRCPACGAVLMPTTPPEPVKKKKKSGHFLLTLLMMALILAALFCLYLAKEIRDLEEDNAVLRKEFSEISESATTDAGRYDQLLSVLQSADLGGGDADFYAEKAVLVLDGDEAVTLKLHAAYNADYRISVQANGDCAQVRFPTDADPAANDFTLTVEPQRPGVMTATFANTYNDVTFDVLIVVVDDDEGEDALKTPAAEL